MSDGGAARRVEGPAPPAGRRLLATVAAGLVPWLVVRSAGTWSLVLAVGLAAPPSPHVTPVWTYVLDLTAGLPPSLSAWPVATLLWGAAVASAAGGLLFGREDRRLTGGLLVLAGLSLLPVAAFLSRRAGVWALPVGTAALWLVAWWGHGDALARVVREGGAGRER